MAPLPNQLIAPSEKLQEDTLFNNARAIIKSAQASDPDKARDEFCYRFYRGEWNEGDYDYLTREGDYAYPAMVRNIPLLKPRFEMLKSEEYIRPFIYTFFASDLESTKQKMAEVIDDVLSVFRKKAHENITATSSAIANLQMLEQQSQKMKEAGEQVPHHIENALVLNNKTLDMKKRFQQEDIDRMIEVANMPRKKRIEVAINKAIKSCFVIQELQRKFNQGFEDDLITNKEIYFIQCPEHMDKPSVEVVNQMRFWWSKDEVDWIGDCEWAMYEKIMSPAAFTDRFRSLNRTKLETIFASKGIGFDNSIGSSSGYRYENSEGTPTAYGGGSSNLNSLAIQHCFWHSQKELFFYQETGEDGSIIEEMTDTRSKIPLGYDYESRFNNDIMYVVIANRTTFVEGGVWGYQTFDSDYKNQGMPFVGLNKWGTTKSHSLVWETKDIQELWNLTHYFKELWLALSGVKGTIMDKGQLPDDMTPEEWQYEKKRGVQWIDTVNKKGQHASTRSSYNQFKDYDDTVSPNIQYLIQILDHFERLAETATGISRGKLGSVVSADQVGTMNQSIQQSGIVTEIRHAKHELVKRKVLEKYVAFGKDKWNKNGFTGQVVGDDLNAEYFNILPGELSGVDFTGYVVSGNKELQKKDKLEQIAIQAYQKQEIAANEIARIITLDDIREVEAALDYYSARTKKLLEDSNLNQQQFEEEQKRVEREFKEFEMQQAEKLKMLDLKVQKAKLEQDMSISKAELAWEKEKHDADIKMKKYDTDIERNTELLYLKKEKGEAELNAKLKSLELALTGVTSNIESLSKESQKEKVKD
jgi:hypothetical protein